MNSARLLLPAAHFIRTNYLESKVVCVSRYFVLLGTALVVDFLSCIECNVDTKLSTCMWQVHVKNSVALAYYHMLLKHNILFIFDKYSAAFWNISHYIVYEKIC